jgi:hypothetical protein
VLLSRRKDTHQTQLCKKSVDMKWWKMAQLQEQLAQKEEA